ncbi:MAG: hypothetical protein NTY02_08265, partial [Acidobacteria bacterium]|nr:hypothetical protein [Acidobacteriota bacterium]
MVRLPRLTLGHVWIVAVLGSIFGYVCTMPVDPADFWHYLKAGQFMVETRSVLDYDRYTFTIASRPFVNIHWGSQVAYYLVYLIGQVPLIVFVHAVAVGLAFALVCAVAWHRTRDGRVAAITTLVAFIVGTPGLALRPQGFSICLLAVTVWLLERRRAWVLPPIFLCWANLHGAFPLGLFVIAAYALCPGPDLIGGGRLVPRAAPVPTVWRPDLPLLAVLAASGAATLITPWGVHLFPAVLAAEAASRSAGIAEWEPLSLLSAPGAVFLAAAAGLLLLRGAAGERWRPRDASLMLLFTYLAMREQRAVVWWGIVAAPFMAETLAAVVQSLSNRRAPLIVREGQPNPGDRVGLNWALTLVLGLHLIWCTPWLKPGYPLLPDAKRPLLAPDTPAAMARVIMTSPGARHVFAEFTWAGYFIWALDTEQKVCYDPRTIIFPPPIMGAYRRVSLALDGWQSTLDRYGVDTLALSK